MIIWTFVILVRVQAILPNPSTFPTANYNKPIYHNLIYFVATANDSVSFWEI